MTDPRLKQTRPAKPLPHEIGAFNRMKSAYPWIIGIALPGMVGLGYGSMAALNWDLANPLLTNEAVDSLVFAAYLIFFIALWWVYFISKNEDVNIRSLRKFLHQTSRLWAGRDYRDERSALNEKSTRTLTMMTMLVSAGILELLQVNRLYIELMGNTAGLTDWQMQYKGFILGVGAICVITAIISFIVSADSLDSIFNRFGKSPSDTVRSKVANIATRHFYQRTIHPRYAGLVGLLLGAVFIIAFHETWIASLALGLIMLIGAPHWFPIVRDDKPSAPPAELIPRWVLGTAPPVVVHYAMLIYR